MARRRLEQALKAGELVQQGKEYPDRFTGIKEEFSIRIEPELDGIYSLQYSFDGRLLAVGTGNGTIRIYNTATGRKYPDVRLSRYGGLPVMCMRFHPRNPKVLIAGTSAGTVLMANLEDYFDDRVLHEQEHDDQMQMQQMQQQMQQKTIKQKEDHQHQMLYHERFVEKIAEKGDNNQPNEINCIDFDYNYANFATAGRDLAIRIYDANTFQEIHKYEGYSVRQNPNDITAAGAAGRLFALKYHPMYDDIFVTGGWENHLKIWDARSNDGVKRTIWGPHICGDALDLKEYKILTGSWCANHALQLFNYTEGNCVRDINFRSKEGPFLYAAQFCDNNIVLAGGSGTNSCQAINMETDELIGEVCFEHPVQAIDSTAGGRLFAVGEGNKFQRLPNASILKMCRLI